MPSNVNSVNIVELFRFNKRELGVILALIEKGPTIVAPLIAELTADGGSIGEAVVAHYNEAKAELDSIAP